MAKKTLMLFYLLLAFPFIVCGALITIALAGFEIGRELPDTFIDWLEEMK